MVGTLKITARKNSVAKQGQHVDDKDAPERRPLFKGEQDATDRRAESRSNACRSSTNNKVPLFPVVSKILERSYTCSVSCSDSDMYSHCTLQGGMQRT